MPLPSLHPSLPQNPNTASGMASSSSTYFSSGAGRAVGSTVGGSSGPGGSGAGGVNRETLKGLQDVVWSDDEVSCWSS
jgi:CCR4-NOT transcription complex subunit 4